VDRLRGKATNPEPSYTQMKDHVERLHNAEAIRETTKEWDKKKTRHTFDSHNKRTLKESGLEQMMT